MNLRPIQDVRPPGIPSEVISMAYQTMNMIEQQKAEMHKHVDGKASYVR